MSNKIKSTIIFFLALVVLTGCKSEEQKNKPVQVQREKYFLPPKQEQPPEPEQIQPVVDSKAADAIIAVIKENIAATEAEDKKRVLKTMHKDSPQLNSTIQGMDFIFANYDMKFNLEQIKVLEINGDEAKVYYKQTTQAVKGEGFPNTRITGIHHMKKEGGKWKIFKTEYLSNQQIR
ncbi:MAG: hypothetical protein RBR74_03520 [Ignavibacteriaceae bacterium]|jgi:ketosteroid isomerase-like protein|nr:hypothetical protein [Ignavibacteriaceae bacterium]